MVPVLLLFLCFVSPVFLDNVPIHRNLTRKSSDLKPMPLLPSSFQHVYMGNEQSTPQTNSKVEEQPTTTKCPSTDLLLKILTLLTKSLPKRVVEPQEFKDIISNIKIILSKASNNNDVRNLYSDVKILEDQVEKISNKVDNEETLRHHSDKNLKAKLSLQYDVPDKCEHILYALVNFINNAYMQVAKYCLVTGNCKVDDIPRVKYDTDGQTKQPVNLDQFLKNPVYNDYTQGSDSPKTDSKHNNIYDVMKALQYYIPNSGSGEKDLQDLLSRLVPQHENVNSNNVPDKPLSPLLKLYPEWLLTESTTQKSINNPLSLPDIYYLLKSLSPDAINNQDYMKVLTEKLKQAENPNKSKQNVEGPTDSDILNLLQNNSKRQPKEIDKHANAGIQNSPPYGTLKHPEQLNNNDIYQLLETMKSQPDQIGSKLLDAYSYVTPDTLNLTPDKTKQYVQLPDLSHLTVTNQDKLKTDASQNEVVELTYMLKRPKLAYEPLYYVKYRVPYYAFIYNLQKLLIKNPYLRNQPRKLYQELLMLSNVTEASGDLKNLEQKELVKLIAANGTLVTAKIVAENKTQGELSGSQNITSNIFQTNKTTDDISSIIEKLLKLVKNDSTEHDLSQRISINPYYAYAYPKTKSLFQNLNYPGKIISSSSSGSSVYGSPSVYGFNSVNKNIPASNIPSYSVYERYPKAG